MKGLREEIRKAERGFMASSWLEDDLDEALHRVKLRIEKELFDKHLMSNGVSYHLEKDKLFKILEEELG